MYLDVFLVYTYMHPRTLSHLYMYLSVLCSTRESHERTLSLHVYIHIHIYMYAYVYTYVLILHTHCHTWGSAIQIQHESLHASSSLSLSLYIYMHHTSFIVRTYILCIYVYAHICTACHNRCGLWQFNTNYLTRLSLSRLIDPHRLNTNYLTRERYFVFNRVRYFVMWVD